MAATLGDVVRRRLLVAGYEPDSFTVIVGWAEFPHRATDREGLMTAALQALEASREEAHETGDRREPSPRPATGSA